MKTKNLLILLVLIIALLLIPNTVMGAETYQDTQQVNYELDTVNKTATVVSSPNVMGDITIPAIVAGDYTVTTIGNEAFRESPGLTGIEIPDTVTSIGDYAFYCCFVLDDLTLPNNLKSIGEFAIYDCRVLASITLPDSLEQLGNSALAYSQFTSIEIPAGVTKISNALLAGSEKLESITIKGDITSIGRNAFHFCENLTNITIPSSVTLIDFGAFQNCTSLKSVTINGSNITITENAFAWSGLEKLIINNSSTSIEKMTFYCCDKLEEITINGNIMNIGMQAFDGNTKLANIIVNGTITSIENSAFYNCGTITMSGTKVYPGSYAGNYAIMNGWNLIPNYTVAHNLENIKIENENIGDIYTADLVPDEGFVYPENITVSIAGVEVPTEDIYNNTVGKVYIESAKITGDIIITASGKVKPEEPPVPTINEYDLIIDVPQEVWANVAGTISVLGGTTSNISLSANGGYAIDSVKKIIEYNNGNTVEENLEFDPKNSNLEIILPDEDINNIRLVVTAIREGIENAKELQEALGGEQFATLNGNMVKLIKDVELSEILNCIAGEYTLDLNGHTITLANNGNVFLAFDVIEETKLTITDSSNGKGTINVPDGDVFIVEGKATLTINGGTYKGFYALNAYEESTVIINGGNFIGEEMAIYFGMDSIGEINNGTFNSNSYAAVGCFDNSKVSIAGGKFTSNEFAALYVERFYGMEPKVTLTGGEFIGNQNAIIVYTYAEEDEKAIEISSILAEGYEFNSNSEVEIITKADHEYNGNYYSYINNEEVTVKDEAAEEEDKPNAGGAIEGEASGEGEKEEKPSDNNTQADTQTKGESDTSGIPQTGDNILLFVGIFVVSIVGIVATIKFKRKK